MSGYLSYLPFAQSILTKKDPIHLTLFVTARCSHDCSVCFYHKEIDTTAVEMTLDQYVRLSASMGELFWLLISGGEPFVREDLTQICTTFVRGNSVRNITIPTNGFATAAILSRTEAISRDNPGTAINIMVSFHGIGRIHDTITGVPGSYKRALATGRALAELSAKYSNLTIGAVVTYSKSNETHFVELVDHLIAEPAFATITAGLTRGDPRESSEREYGLDNFIAGTGHIVEAYKARKKGYAQSGYDLYTAVYRELYRDNVDAFSPDKTHHPCYAGKLNVVVSPEGDLYPCELLDRKIGNIVEADFDFSSLWNSLEAKAIRAHIAESRCSCFHTCYATTNILFNPVRLAGVALRSLADNIETFLRQS